jgi:endoplasmic reticulum Man9GlcNAc2 1,2-alpha-mannosidase
VFGHLSSCVVPFCDAHPACIPQGIESQLLQYSSADRYLYVAEREGGLIAKMDHLVCFFPGGPLLQWKTAFSVRHSLCCDRVSSVLGVLALSSLRANMSNSAEAQNAAHHLTIAKELMRTCYRFYTMTPIGDCLVGLFGFGWKVYWGLMTVCAGLSPEIARFDDARGPYVDPGARHSFLRPETVESLFVLYRVTGDQLYRDWGTDIFNAIQKHARVEGGFTTIDDVTRTFSRAAGVVVVTVACAHFVFCFLCLSKLQSHRLRSETSWSPSFWPKP